MAVGRTIGRVNLIVGMDGRALPAEAEAAGREAGAAASDGFNNEFDRGFSDLGAELSKDMRNNGELSGNSFTDAMQDVIHKRRGDLSTELAGIFGNRDGLEKYFTGVQDTGVALQDLRTKLRSLNESGGLSDTMFRRLHKTLDDFVPNVKIGSTEVEKLGKTLESVGNKGFGGGGGGGGIGTDAKQIIAIIAIIAGAAPQIVSLGSLIGSSLVIAVGALAVLAAGVGVLIAGFIELSGDIKSLPASIQPAATAFQGLMKPLQALQSAIAVGLFSQMAGPFAQLGQTISSLTPAFQVFATQVGGALGLIIAQLNSPAFSAGLQTFLAAAGPIFTALTQAALSFGGAISNVILDSLPYVLKFATGLQRIGDAFLAWTNSDAGRAAITAFFEHGQQLIGPLLDLVGSLGKMFGELVTAKTVSDTATFLTTLQGVIPFIQGLLNALNQINIFQTVAEILTTIGGALVPIFNILVPIIQVILDLVHNALGPLALVINFIGVLLEPLKIAFQIFGSILQATKPFVDAIYAGMNQVVLIFGQVYDTIYTAIKPAIDQLIAAFVGLLPSPAQLADIIQTRVIPMVQKFADWITNHLIPVLIDIVNHVTDFIDSLGGFSGIEAKVKTVYNAFKAFIAPISAILKGVSDAINIVVSAIKLLNGTPLTAKAHAAGGVIAAHAAGGIVNRPTFITPYDIAGEAGPEAIVPLSGPLSNVNPEVRDLAAYARNGAGGAGQDGHYSNFEPGAIQLIVPTDDPEVVATTVVDHIIAGL